MKIPITTILAVCTTLAYASTTVPGTLSTRDALAAQPYRTCGPKGLKCVLTARDTDDVDAPDDDAAAANHADALADSDEDYDARPDGLTEEEYEADLDAKDEEDDSLPEKRNARIPNNACGPVLSWLKYGKCAPLKERAAEDFE